jgi:hypothetical protein
VLSIDCPAATSFSPDSTRFLIVYNDGTLIGWRIDAGPRAQAVQLGNDGELENCTSVTLSHSGKQVFYATNDGTIRTLRVTGK